MSYIGFKPVQGNVIVDEFTSSGGSTYTLSSAPSMINAVEVVVGGLTQTSSAYSLSGTTLTLAGVASGTKIIVRQHGEKLLLQTPADATVGITKLSATGTASSSTFLRGDNSWQTAGSTSASDLTSGTLPIARIANDAIDSIHYAAGSIDEEHIAADAVNFSTHLKAGTDGELITWDASGNPAAVAVGTATHILTSGGAGGAPTFQAPAAAGFGVLHIQVFS